MLLRGLFLWSGSDPWPHRTGPILYTINRKTLEWDGALWHTN